MSVKGISARNYVTPFEQKSVQKAVDDVLLTTHMSYPEDSLLAILYAAIPGVEIREFEFGPTIRGAIYKKSSDFETPRIIIRKSLRPEQKTFALAHELGHYQLNHPGDKNFMLDKMTYDGSKKQQLEAQAQYFAASLLMPEHKFKWLAKVLDDESLARRFGVPIAAVRVRRNWLKLDG